MKVGIVSQFNYDNIGNKLQNYALQQQLLKFADEVITIKNKSLVFILAIQKKVELDKAKNT